MKRYISYFILVLGLLIASVAMAKSIDTNMRGLDPAGNWRSVAVDANGQLKVTT